VVGGVEGTADGRTEGSEVGTDAGDLVFANPVCGFFCYVPVQKNLYLDPFLPKNTMPLWTGFLLHSLPLPDYSAAMTPSSSVCCGRRLN